MWHGCLVLGDFVLLAAVLLPRAGKCAVFYKMIITCNNYCFNIKLFKTFDTEVKTKQQSEMCLSSVNLAIMLRLCAFSSGK